MHAPHTHKNIYTATIYKNTYKDQHTTQHSKKCKSSTQLQIASQFHPSNFPLI